MFLDREEAGHRLAERLKGRPLRDPLVLAIPRGGVVVGAALAHDLGADLDVALVRKLRAPDQPELAIGAIAEGVEVFLNPNARLVPDLTEDYLREERQHQLAEIKRRARLFRSLRPRAPVAGRSVLVTDDGIATGSTTIAALNLTRQQYPCELIVAVPVAPPDRLDEVARSCDEVVCLLAPQHFWAVGEWYEDFEQIDDAQVVELLRSFSPAGGAGAR
jgi:predicted phosphoribosyltransferase